MSDFRTRRRGPFQVVQTENHVLVYYYGRRGTGYIYKGYRDGKPGWTFPGRGMNHARLISNQPEDDE